MNDCPFLLLNVMARPQRYHVLIRWFASLLLVMGAAQVRPAAGQFSATWAPDEAPAGSTVSVFATWESREAVDGFDVRLPLGARLRDVHVLRFGRDHQELRVLSGEHGNRVLLEEPRRGPHEVVVTIDLPASGLDVSWRILPLQRDAIGELVSAEAGGTGGSVRLVEGASSAEDLALVPLEAGGPILLRADRIPAMYAHMPFELRFWMKTTGLDEVVLSTWDGRENVGYPLELEVGPAGRLFVFRGGNGVHESISSRRPIADGAWHEIAIVSSGERTALFVDGVEADAFTTPGPAGISVPVLALGSRIPAGESESRLFSGYIDEITVSAETNPNVNPGSVAPAHINLSFDDRLAGDVLARGSAAPRFAPSDRARAFAPRQLAAQLAPGGVRLSWEASSEDGGTLTVERSSDRRHFEQVQHIELRASSTDAGRYELIVEEAHDGVRYYRVVHTLPDGRQLASHAIKVGLAELPEESVELLGNFPNPFNTRTTIAYRLTESRHVELSVWDLSGQQLAVLVNEVVPEGYHEVGFSAADLPSGTYFVRLQTPTRTVSEKMILAK